MSERWYGAMFRSDVKQRGRVQIEGKLRDAIYPRTPADTLTLPEHVLRLADAEYQHQFGGCQDYERMQERGGLGVLEIIALLADLAERHGAKPTTPRPPVPEPSEGETP